MQRYIREYADHYSIGLQDTYCHTIVKKSPTAQQEIESYLSEKEYQIKKIQKEKENEK